LGSGVVPPLYLGPLADRFETLISDLLTDAQNAHTTPGNLAAITDAAIESLTNLDADANGQNGGALYEFCSTPASGGSGGSSKSGRGPRPGTGTTPLPKSEWWNDSAGLGGLPVLRGIISYLTGYSAAQDRTKELEVKRKARDPNKTLQAGDIRTAYSGESQLAAAATAESEIKQFGRDRVRDAALIVAGEAIRGAAAAGGDAVARWEADLERGYKIARKMKKLGYTKQEIARWLEANSARALGRMQRMLDALDDTLPQFPAPWE
jgi:hypothetical protein